MAALWSFLGFVVLCSTSCLCAAYSLAQSQQVFQWPGQQSSLAFEAKQPPPPADPFQQCNVEDFEKVQCGEPGISPENCATINCCFDGQQCYYAKAVTVQCTRDGQFVVVAMRAATLPRLSLDSISLLGGSDPLCAPVGTTAAFAIYLFPVTACGTSMMMDGDFLVYENKMTSTYEVGVGPLGSITRDSHYELLFQCRYSGTSVEALVVDVHTVQPPVAAPALRLANGRCFTKGCMKEDAASPVTKVLTEPIYVEGSILERADPNVVHQFVPQQQQTPVFRVATGRGEMLAH